MSLRLVGSIPLHVVQGARAAIWAKAMAGRILGRVDAEFMRDLAAFLAHVEREALGVWSSAFLPAVIDAFPLPVGVAFDSAKATHPWEYRAYLSPPRISGPGFWLVPRGEVPAEAVESAMRALSRPLPPGAIIGNDLYIPRPPSPVHVRVGREVVVWLREDMDSIRRINPRAAQALESGRFIVLVDLLRDDVAVDYVKVSSDSDALVVGIRGGFVHVYPLEVTA
jgi:hypothetical protein